ncbi:MAG TPA: NAD(P)-dependent oxidoreductase, partial [Armatimonadota bacterium]|nr:NAD(P)-dependent oxidoreductase [Armatimonadota bacterium]
RRINIETYALIGMGNMGRPMAANLLKAGFDMTVYNRHPEKARELVVKGARCATTIADTVTGADVIITMVSNDVAVRETIFGEDGVLAHAATGQTLIDMSTVSPDLSREISEAVKPHGIHFLDAPVSGSVKPATEGTLVILVGGAQGDYERCLPLFQTMGKDIFYLGPNGSGAHMKLCINMLLGSIMQTVAESIVLAEKGGLTREQMLNVINVSACQTPIVKLKTPSYLNREYPAAFALKHMAKDFGLAMAQAQRLRVTLPITAAGNESFKAAENQGIANQDIAGIIKLIEQLSGQV